MPLVKLTIVKLAIALAIVLMPSSVLTKTTNVAPGNGTLNAAISSASAGDVLQLEVGSYICTDKCKPTESIKYAGLCLSKASTLLGANHGRDARGRSVTGLGVIGYSGPADASETTLAPTTSRDVSVYILTSGVTLDGLTITANSDRSC